MSFIIDQQTRAELNLLDRHQPGSIYYLFNEVKTKGGAKVLEKMIEHPMQDPIDINARSTIFYYFQEASFDFPFDESKVQAVGEWLKEKDAGGRFANLLSATKNKILAMAVHDEREANQVKGLLAISVVLKQLKSFVKSLKGEQKRSLPLPIHFETELNVVAKIFEDARLERLLKLAEQRSVKQTVSIDVLAYYNYLLKQEMLQQMNEMLSFIFHVDVYISVAAIAKRSRFTYALALQATVNVLTINALKHPTLKGAVGNDISLDKMQNLLFLTGANMAGKSTLMKSIGIAVYLAHIGFPVAADEMTFSVKDGLFTSINVPDSIKLGYSHFYAEVLRVKSVAALLADKKKMVVIFDELFKGTNVKDAYEATLEVTKGFAAFRNNLFVVSTHITEVGEALYDRRNVQFVYMPTQMNDNRPVYTYKLKEGISADRQGMLLIRNEGILELLDKKNN